MTNRINDQSHLDQKLLEERQDYTQKQTNQRAFAQKLFDKQSSEQQQNQLGSQVKAKTDLDSQKYAKDIKETPKKTPPAPEKPAATKQTTKTTPQTKLSQSASSKKSESKKESKKTSDEKVKREKGKADAILDQVARQRHDTDLNDGDSQDPDAFFQQAVALSAPLLSPAQGPTGPMKPTLSQDVINQLVDHIYASTNSQGLKELTIELKSGILAGAQIQVSSNKGKVKLHFRSDDQRAKSLLRNSKDEIAKRLGEKNLSLLEFVVD